MKNYPAISKTKNLNRRQNNQEYYIRIELIKTWRKYTMFGVLSKNIIRQLGLILNKGFWDHAEISYLKNICKS